MPHKTRAELLLEEHYPNGAVEAGFLFKFEEVADPPRIMLEIIGRTSGDGMRLWFEIDQFKQFASACLKTMSLVDAMEVLQGLIDGSDTDA